MIRSIYKLAERENGVREIATPFLEILSFLNNLCFHGQGLFPWDIIISSLKIAIELGNDHEYRGIKTSVYEGTLLR